MTGKTAPAAAKKAPASKKAPAPASKKAPEPAPKEEPAPTPKEEPAPTPKEEPAPTPKEEHAPAPAAETPPAPEHPPGAEHPAAPAAEHAPAHEAEATPAHEEGSPPAAPAEAPAPEPEPEKPKEEPPSIPLSLAVEEVTENSVTLTWKAPEQTGKSSLDGYVVEICKDGSSDWTAVNKEPFLSTRYKIQDLGSGEKVHVRVKAISASGTSVPATLEQPILIREITDLPRIRLPRQLRQVYVRHVGEAVNLLIPFQGKPQPQVTWTKDNQPLDTSRVNIRNTEKDTIFFIRTAQRSDSGKYQLAVRINGAEDKAILDIQIIERPGPPQNLKLVDVWGFNVALEWSPPADNGNSEIKGYTVQKSDKKSGKWFTVLERCTRTSCTISDLIIGNTYSFRVFSENACGMSETAAVASGVAHIKKTKTVYQPQKIPERDMMEPPKFTQPLTDRATTRGYSTHLFCSVRGFPQPKIIWMKNKMEIREDPKYIAMIEQGVCSLEIRKPSPFDAGVYTCKAVNPLGEASVDCKLDVKMPK
ncbi:myosin-binding protein H [Phasianus colchicus]|uniref:Myosin-binding protein H n=1 Tax=Phasianus colchicus TaxID=9054 RepID=A0A669QEY9_PHACC|nr:myosin-binding protein H [Phasianus colchicus]